ncbi:tripartite tricarboxylate transporter substrate binding protein [Bordetella sp. BOR01]|uniref:Bug family tripartite tricarboxylate transporter substrate binding protein n=1 Tax=Bordetella sp. BOR01 TaxID=2854779 RepID=UPI001C4677D0|nr:tripartite tricarboxylate transporter substrate binding protein [Bordetella sp. BOR01]MBV7482130.1 tripartite tricarboxylate transporter substrate binding protein [Bordetella sp. BOR01]
MIGTRLLAVILSCAALLAGNTTNAETYPSRPIKLVLGFSAGGGADAIARIYAAELEKILGTPVIVENRAGAYEQLAGRYVQNAAPDGYTLWLATTGGIVQAPLIRDMPYDPKHDFTHIGVIAEADAVLAVKKDFPAKSVDELVEYARAHPNAINFGSAGTGAPSHLLVEYIQSLLDIKMTHIPYKGAGDVARELMAGSIDFAVVVPAAAAPLINAGKIDAIAVTGKQRVKSLPDVPTLEEGSIPALKGMSVYAFYAMLGPAGMPKDVTGKLNDAFNEVSSLPAVQQRAAEMDFRPVTGTSEEFTQRIDEDMALWGTVAKRIK